MQKAYWIEHVTADDIYCLTLIAAQHAIATLEGPNTPEGRFDAAVRTADVEDTLEDMYCFIDGPSTV